MRSSDPGAVRKHKCAGCPRKIIRGKLCPDCQARVDERIEAMREGSDE